MYYDEAALAELSAWQDDYPVNPERPVMVYVRALGRWVPEATAAAYGVYPKKF